MGYVYLLDLEWLVNTWSNNNGQHYSYFLMHLGFCNVCLLLQTSEQSLQEVREKATIIDSWRETIPRAQSVQKMVMSLKEIWCDLKKFWATSTSNGTLSDICFCVSLANWMNLHSHSHFAGFQRCLGIQFGKLGTDILYNYLLGILFTVFSIPHDWTYSSTRIFIYFVLWYYFKHSE